MLENSVFFIALAVLSLVILTRWIKPGDFRALSWKLIALASALFWSILAILLLIFYWDDYYSFFADSSQRLLIPLAALIVYPLWSVFLRWLALHLPGNPVAAFCLLGGLQAIPEHAIAIYKMRILDIPFLQEATPISIFIFSYFEYLVFWSLVLVLARLLLRFGSNRG